MNEFEIEEATRSGSKIVISLAGDSGCGKTYSALRLARGLVGKDGKIGVIDTEQKRASLYANCFGGFKVINFEAPYSPDRYIKAIKVFKEAGYNAVVIDSMSHEWESLGGVLDMVDKSSMKGIGAWKVPKSEHRALMNYILNCGMHIILCYRVKYEMIEGPDKDKRGNPILIRSPKPTIVCEPNTDYDLTVKLFLDKKTKYPKIDKSPEGIEFLFNPNEYLTEYVGEMLINWLNSVQRDADAIVFEGLQQDNKVEWAQNLNDYEKYLARKYWSKINVKQEIQEVEEL